MYLHIFDGIISRHPNFLNVFGNRSLYGKQPGSYVSILLRDESSRDRDWPRRADIRSRRADRASRFRDTRADPDVLWSSKSSRYPDNLCGPPADRGRKKETCSFSRLKKNHRAGTRARERARLIISRSYKYKTREPLNRISPTVSENHR